MAFALSKNYTDILHRLKEKIRHARLRTTLAGNNELLAVFWEIGNTINKQEEAAGWRSKKGGEAGK